MNTNQVLIFGVGRSGTTAIYSLLQEILSDVCPDDVDFVYEPFFWDRGTFNKRYVEIKDEFSEIASLSLDGIIADRTTPLLIDQGEETAFLENEYLKSIVSPSGGQRNILTKFIRANGRISLFRKLAPKAKVIFVMRNPMDVVNSVSNMFSFFGEDFIPSDFERFKKEIVQKEMYDKGITLNSEEEKAFAYWYYMNRHFVDYYQSSSENILPIVYEDYNLNRESTVQSMCDFLGVGFKPEYVKASQAKVGKISGSPNLTLGGYEYIKSMMHLYAKLTADVGVVFENDFFLERYKRLSFTKADAPYEAKTALYLKHVVAGKTKRIQNIQISVEKQRKEIVSLNALLKKKWKEIADLTARVEVQCGRVAELGETIAKLEATVAERNGRVAELGETIAKLEATVAERIKRKLKAIKKVVESFFIGGVERS